MEIKAYEFEVDKQSKVYEFSSDGPKGRIISPAEYYYNLAFGDLNDDDDINDLVISNNKDAERVLITVANIVIDFTNKNPNVLIWIEGSTTPRTRLYQIGINKYWHEIEPMFDVYGYTSSNDLEPFQFRKNYLAFVARRKNRNFKF